MAVMARAPRAAFTLAELLIVVGIIALLAAMLYPALVMVKAQANAVKCDDNMRNIAIAIEVYRQNAERNFPGSFQELVSLDALPPKALLCPLDASLGTDPSMGRARPSSNWQDYSRLYYQAIGSTSAAAAIAAPGATLALTSYDFEANGSENADVCTDKDIIFFYQDLLNASGASSLPAAGTVAWSDCKLHEQANCNLDPATGKLGASFPTGAVPILRCYHHWDWQRTANQLAMAQNADPAAYPAKVENISLDFGVIRTIPYWEIGCSPALKLWVPP